MSENAVTGVYDLLVDKAEAETKQVALKFGWIPKTEKLLGNTIVVKPGDSGENLGAVAECQNRVGEFAVLQELMTIYISSVPNEASEREQFCATLDLRNWVHKVLKQTLAGEFSIVAEKFNRESGATRQNQVQIVMTIWARDYLTDDNPQYTETFTDGHGTVIVGDEQDSFDIPRE